MLELRTLALVHGHREGRFGAGQPAGRHRTQPCAVAEIDAQRCAGRGRPQRDADVAIEDAQGRVCFKIILRELGVEIGLTELASHPHPVDEKVRMTLEILAELFNKFSDQQVGVSHTGMKYLWTVNRCPFCWHLRVEDPICLQQVGLLQEALYWVSSGKFYSVEEVDCIGKGDKACVIVVDQRPLE